MNNPTNPLRNAIGDRTAHQWWQFPADVYLDHRRLSWVLAEELGAVHFLPPAGIVLVHRKRAENIAAALLGGRDVLMLEDALALPARIPPEPVRMPRLPAAGPSRARTSTPFSSPAACCASPRGGAIHRALPGSCG